MDVSGVGPALTAAYLATNRGKKPPLASVAAGRSATVNDDINVLALIKGKERYVFLYDDSQRAAALRTLGRYASDSGLSFTWYDAAVLSQKVRQSDQHVPVPNRMSLPQSSDLDE